MAISERPLTLDEFLKLPDEKPALEFEEGKVTQKVSPQGEHSVLQSWSVGHFNRLGNPNQVAYAFPELRATFGGRSYVPDVSVYRWDRIPRSPSGRVANVFTEPPDIAVEIVSPEQSVNGLIRRCLWYVDHGVRAALLIDSGDQSVSLFRPEGRPLIFGGSDVIDLGEVLPGFQLDVQELFASLHF